MQSLIGAGLTIRSFLQLYGMTSDLPGDRLLVLRVSLPDAKYATPANREQLVQRLPCAASNFPLGRSTSWPFDLFGKPTPENAKASVASQTFGFVPVRTTSSGKVFRHEALIHDCNFLARYPSERSNSRPRRSVLPITRKYSGATISPSIIGIYPDIRKNGPSSIDFEPLVYIPYRLQPQSGFGIVSRVSGSPKPLIASFRRKV